MQEKEQKPSYSKGQKIQIGKIKAIIVSDLIKFKQYNAIYADIIENTQNGMVCGVCKIQDRVALVLRDKEKLLEMRLKCRRKKSYLLPRIGALFWKKSTKRRRTEKKYL